MRERERGEEGEGKGKYLHVLQYTGVERAAYLDVCRGFLSRSSMAWSSIGQLNSICEEDIQYIQAYNCIKMVRESNMKSTLFVFWMLFCNINFR